MIDKSSELWDRKNVHSVFKKSLCDAEIGGLKFVGTNQSGQSSQSQAHKRLHPVKQHLLQV